MSDPKDIPPAMTAEEIQEKLRSGDFKIVFSSHEIVTQYEEQVGKILIAVGRYMAAEDENSIASQEEAEEWADSCFVSDMSTMGDYCLYDKHYEAIGKELGVPVSRKDYVVAVAARMAGAN